MNLVEGFSSDDLERLISEIQCIVDMKSQQEERDAEEAEKKYQAKLRREELDETLSRLKIVTWVPTI